MKLAKQALDVGLYADDLDAGMAFWGDVVGLPYEELLKVGGGVHQHRFGLHGGVLKLNHARDAMSEAPTCLRGLRIASLDVVTATHRSPEGVAVELVAGEPSVEIITASSSPVAAQRWWVDGLGAADHGDGRYQVGTTMVTVLDEPASVRSGPLRSRGFRYLTVQIHDVETEHTRMVDLGFEGATAPIRLGDIAYISFLRSPDGDWLELSQRRSLTGPLPVSAH